MNSEVLMKLDIDMGSVNDFDPEYVSHHYYVSAFTLILPEGLAKVLR